MHEILHPRQGPPVHVVAEGHGDPTVVFTSGLAGAHYDWGAVVPNLSERHLVLRLDRPGLGASPPRRGMPTLAEEADRLAGLIEEQTRVAAIVVAHSVAALHAEAFGRRYPGLLGGLVLVDPSCGTPASSVPAWLLTGADRLGRAVLAAADRTGAGAVIGPPAWSVAAGHNCLRPVPEKVHQAGRETFQSSAAMLAAWREHLAYQGMLADLAALRETTEFPPVPVTVLTATGGMQTAFALAWQRCHQRLASRLNARHRLLPDAGHQIAWDAPAAVVAAVNDVTGRLA